MHSRNEAGLPCQWAYFKVYRMVFESQGRDLGLNLKFPAETPLRTSR
jgi:hypothetical protein